MTDVLVVRHIAEALEVAGDGRTIVGRCVPYGVPATVCDPMLNDGVPYTEVYRAGAFRRAARAPERVLLNFEHSGALLDQCGRAAELVERDDGLHGSFRAIGAPGDHALELIASGAVTGLSVGVLVSTRLRLVDGVCERTTARLEHVALTTHPAYDTALVTGVRSGTTTSVRLDEVRARTDELRVRFGR